MKLRKANESDIDAILNLHNSLFDYTYSYENYANELNLDIASFYVLENENELAGYFVIHTIFEQLEIVMIAIAKEYQGLGYGKFLLETIEYLGLKNKCTNIIIEVAFENKKAIEFYKRNKFERIDVRKNYYGVSNDAYVYRKELI